MTGPGALAATLQRIAANQMDRPVGSITYTAMLTPRGGIKCDLTVTRLADERFMIVTGGAMGLHDLDWMESHLPGDGSASLDRHLSGTSVASASGGRAPATCSARVCEDDLSDAAFPYLTAEADNGRRGSRAGPAHLLRR